MSLLTEYKAGVKPLCWGPALLYPNAVWEQVINLGVPSVEEFDFEIYARASEHSTERLFDVPFEIEDDDNGNKVICTQAVNDLTDMVSTSESKFNTRYINKLSSFSSNSSEGMVSVFITCQFTEKADPNKTRILVAGEVYIGASAL